MSAPKGAESDRENRNESRPDEYFIVSNRRAAQGIRDLLHYLTAMDQRTLPNCFCLILGGTLSKDDRDDLIKDIVSKSGSQKMGLSNSNVGFV